MEQLVVRVRQSLVGCLEPALRSDNTGRLDQSEHEDEKGSIDLHDHEFNRALSIEDVYETPFRELWMRNGRQTFDPLKTL